MDVIEQVGQEVKEVIWKTCSQEIREKCRIPAGCEEVEIWDGARTGDEDETAGEGEGSSSRGGMGSGVGGSSNERRMNREESQSQSDSDRIAWPES
jgi:hypothetical protein